MQRNVCKAGYIAGLVATAATLLFVIVQLLQIAGVFSYPWDEILIYGFSFCIVIPFMLEILAMHHTTSEDKRFWTHAAIVFTIVYAVFATANYVVQLATVIPMTLKGKADDISILAQTPHSLFWDFDAIAYIFMGFATLVALPAFEKKGIEKKARWIFLANALVTPLIAFVYFFPEFSNAILFIGFPWAITAPGSMFLLALVLRKRLNDCSVDHIKQKHRSKKGKIIAWSEY